MLRGIKKSNTGFCGFGEAYFTKVNSGEIKGWTRHKLMTLNLIVPEGRVLFVLFDERPDSPTRGKFKSAELSLENYNRLTISPGIWLAFQGMGEKDSLILNFADFEHDPLEMEKKELDQIRYNWSGE